MADVDVERGLVGTLGGRGDRRQKRAVAPMLAAEYLLDAHRERVGAEAVVLFDEGELFASSAPGLREPDDLLSRDGDLFTHRLDLAGRSMVLASLGARVRSVRGIEEALARILA